MLPVYVAMTAIKRPGVPTWRISGWIFLEPERSWFTLAKTTWSYLPKCCFYVTISRFSAKKVTEKFSCYLNEGHTMTTVGRFRAVCYTAKHVHPPHQHHRSQRPGGLALAYLASLAGVRLIFCVNEPQHHVLLAGSAPAVSTSCHHYAAEPGIDLKEIFCDF
jgi:hypothetical protein